MVHIWVMRKILSSLTTCLIKKKWMAAMLVDYDAIVENATYVTCVMAKRPLVCGLRCKFYGRVGCYLPRLVARRLCLGRGHWLL